ncbi:uncharacterized protein LOC144820300 [Lissotriton helveticus]
MQSRQEQNLAADNAEQPLQPLLPPPAEVDRLLSSAIAQALAPLQDSVNKLSAHVFKSGSGVFGDSGAGPSGVNYIPPRTAKKRDAGHLEGFNKLAEAFHKSARTLSSAPFRGDDSPGDIGGSSTQDLDPEEEFPLEGVEDEEDYFNDDEDESSEDMSDIGRSWRPKANVSDCGEGDQVPHDMFDPTTIYRPRSSEWIPEKSTADYVAAKLRQPLSQDVRLRLRSECPRPSLPNRVAATPEIDPKLCTFFAKYVKDPKKGIDRSWKACQDKLLDVVGPLTKIIELAQRSKESGMPLPVEDVAGWAQRAVCLLGNANCALSAERRRSLLLRIDPKLGELSSSEAGSVAQGTLFGDPFVKELGKFVATFSALDKAQASMKKMFPKKVFGGAGRGRGRSSGRQSQQGPNRAQQRRNNGWNDGRQGSFYPSRGGRGQGRGRGGKQFNSKGFNEQDLIDLEVQAMLQKGAIIPSSLHPNGFLSNIFLVEKKDKGFRPVINLRSFNEWLIYRHFKMEGIHLLRDLLLQNDWLVRLDLKDAYLSVPIYPPHCRFLQFLWRDQIYKLILYSPLWSFLSTLVLYQTPTTRGGTSSHHGISSNNLLGRHSSYESVQGSSPPTPSGDHIYASISGICHQRPEIRFGPSARNDFSGFPDTNDGCDVTSSFSENYQDQEGDSQGPSSGSDFSTSFAKDCCVSEIGVPPTPSKLNVRRFCDDA